MRGAISQSKRACIIRDVAVILILGNLLYFYFPIRPIIWRVSFLALAFVAFFSKDNRPTNIEKIILAFMAFNLLHFLVSYIWLTPTTTQLGNILYSMSAFLLFPYLGRRGVLSSAFFSIALILLVLAGVAYYYHAQAIAAVILIDFDEDRFTNNASVIFLFLLPSLFLVKNNVLRYVVLAVCVFFIITSVKRGNILAAIIPITLLIWYSLRNSRGSIWKTLFVMAAIVALYYLGREWIVGNAYFFDRLDATLEGSTSNRDLIYASAWNTWTHSDNIITILFGYGFDGTIHHLINGYRAHNDWLEILVDYGLVGVVFYLSIFIAFYKTIRKQSDLQLKIVLIAAVSIWFMKTLYSMGFSDEYLALIAMPIGVAMTAFRPTKSV